MDDNEKKELLANVTECFFPVVTKDGGINVVLAEPELLRDVLREIVERLAEVSSRPNESI